MGIVLSRVFQALFGSKEVRILILGLDNAGKTTILYRLQNEADDNIQTIPTIGFNVETLQYKNIKFQVRWWCWRQRCGIFLDHGPNMTYFSTLIVCCFYDTSHFHRMAAQPR